MITKRIIPCLDVRNGRVVKGTNFEGIKDVADPVELEKQLLQFQTKKQHPQAQTQPTTNQATQQLLMLKTTVKLKLSFMRSLLRLQSRTLLTLQKTAFMTVLLSTESLPAL